MTVTKTKGENEFVLAAAIRKFLTETGDFTASAEQLHKWLGANYPTATYRRSYLSSSLSTQRRKLAPQTTKQEVASVSVSTLMKISPLIKEFGGLDRVDEILTAVDRMVQTAGGIKNLKECVGALREIRS